MSERFLIKREEIDSSEVTTGTGGITAGDVFREIEIESQYDRISVYVVPLDSGDTANDSSVDISYKMNGQFFKLKGSISGVAVRNEIFPFTTEDVFDNIRVDISSGADDPDEGYLIEIWGYRP